MGTVDEIAPPQTASIELELAVAGPEADIRTALGERGISHWQHNGDAQHRLLLRLQDQSAVDQCIDDLRRRGISIIGLSRRKITLEDAFLTLLQEE
jgi:hypothetical protein